LATVEENQAAVPWALEEGPRQAGRLNHDQISRITTVTKLAALPSGRMGTQLVDVLGFSLGYYREGKNDCFAIL
jgi:hypothetical protein